MAEITVMSFNIRFDNPNEEPQDQWSQRRSTCAQIIEKYRPHLLGLQEPHKNQVDELGAILPHYQWFGTGRYISMFGLNETHNELNPVFYDTSKLTLEASGTFWFSDTPTVPQSKWGCSAFPRIATWGRFAVNGTPNRLCFVNTHFDHESEDARTKAADMLIKALPEVALGLPTVVVGDLNCGAGSPALAKLSQDMAECSSACCETIPGMLGKTGTFVGFDKSINSQIDFIFAKDGLTPHAYGTVADECPNGRCCSDHRPIMATLTFDAYARTEPLPAPENGILASAAAAPAGQAMSVALPASEAADAAAQAVAEVAKMGAGLFFSKLTGALDSLEKNLR